MNDWDVSEHVYRWTMWFLGAVPCLFLGYQWGFGKGLSAAEKIYESKAALNAPGKGRK